MKKNQPLEQRKMLLGTDFPIGGIMHIDLGGKRHSTIMRGVVTEECIITDIPVLDGKKVVFNYSSVFDVHIVWGDRLVGFRSAILDIFPSLNIMLMQFPDKLEMISIRTAKRFKINTPISLKAAGKVINGAMIDISPTGAGCLFKSSEVPESNKNYLGSFYLPSGELVEDIPVTAKQMREGSGTVQVGISFGDSKHPAFGFLSRYCSNLQPYERHSVCSK